MLLYGHDTLFLASM